MDTLKILKQLKKITPDPDYTLKSRLLITGEESGKAPAFVFPVFTMRAFVANILKSGSAIALSAALFLMLAGSFSLWKFLVPHGTALIDPAGLRAEAQAIDIQIQLSSLGYREPDFSNETSSPAMAAPTQKALPIEIGKEARNEAEQLGLVSASTSALTIDEALDQLSQ